MSKKKGFLKSSTMELVVGAGLTTFVEPFIDRFTSNFGVAGTISEIVKVALGSYLMSRQRGIIKGVGISLVILGSNRLISNFLASKVAASTGAF